MEGKYKVRMSTRRIDIESFIPVKFLCIDMGYGIRHTIWSDKRRYNLGVI